MWRVADDNDLALHQMRASGPRAACAAVNVFPSGGEGRGGDIVAVGVLVAVGLVALIGGAAVVVRRRRAAGPAD